MSQDGRKCVLRFVWNRCGWIYVAAALNSQQPLEAVSLMLKIVHHDSKIGESMEFQITSKHVVQAPKYVVLGT